MADISKINLSGAVYNIKDATARANLNEIQNISNAEIDEITDLVLEPLPSSYVYGYETAAAMQADLDLQEGMIAHTNGFTTSGDGDAAYYTISNSGTADGSTILVLQNGLRAIKVSERNLIDAIPNMSATTRGIAKVGAGLAMNGDALELDGNGDIMTAVTSWLNAHPEATTTVEDGAVTTDKLANSAVTDNKLAQTGGVLERVSNFSTLNESNMLDGVTFVNGSINNLTGEEFVSETRIRSDYFIPLNNIESFTVYTNSGYQYVIDWYDSNKNVLREFHTNHGYWLSNKTVYYANEYKNAAYVKFLIATSNNDTIVPSESFNLHATCTSKLVNIANFAEAGIEKNLSSYSWSIGSIVDGINATNNTRVRSERIPMGKGSVVTVKSAAAPYKQIYVHYYDTITGKYLGNNGSWTSYNITIPYDCDVIILVASSDIAEINDSKIEEYASAVTAYILPVIKNDEVQRLAVNAIFTSDLAYFEPIGMGDGMWVKLNNMWVRGSLYNTTSWANVLPASHATSPAGVTDCLFIPHNSSLVYDSKTDNFAIVSSTDIETFSQVSLFSIGTAIDTESVIGGIGYHLYAKWLQAQSDETDKALAYASLFNVAEETEQFIYFTDPHLMGAYSDTTSFLAKFNRYIDTIAAYNNSTSSTFVMCGGDWLNNADNPNVAKWKLGLIYGKCKQFNKFYGVVGNHDTNYQGVDDAGNANSGLLANQTIANAMFGNKHANYYSFDGTHTHFYVFDSGTDWDIPMNSYRWEQVAWFANALLTDDKAHSAVSIHIWYTNYQDQTDDTISTLATNIASVIAAYNARSSVTLNGSTYNFASCIGHVEFVICGHTHYDKSGMSGNIPVVNTLNTQNGGTPSFDLVYVDYDNRAINTIRVGTGSDRMFNLASF